MRSVYRYTIALVLCILYLHASVAVDSNSVRRALRSKRHVPVPSSDERDANGAYESAMALLRDVTESNEDRDDRLREEVKMDAESRKQALDTILANAASDAKVPDHRGDILAESYRGTAFDLDAVGAQRNRKVAHRPQHAALQPTAQTTVSSSNVQQTGNPITPPPSRPVESQVQEPTEPEAPIIYPIDAPGDKKAASAAAKSKAAPVSKATAPVTVTGPAPSVGQPQAPAPAPTPTPPIPYPIDMGNGGNAKPPASSQSSAPTAANSGVVSQTAPAPTPAPTPKPAPAPSPKPPPIIYPIDAGKGQGQAQTGAAPAPAPAAQDKAVGSGSLLSRAESALSSAWEGAKHAASSVWDRLSSAWKSVTGSVSHVFDHFRDHEHDLQEAREAEIQARRKALSELAAKQPAPTATEQPPQRRPAPTLVVAHGPHDSEDRTHASARFKSSHTATATAAAPKVHQAQVRSAPAVVSDDVVEQRRSVDSMTDRITAVLRKLRLHEREPSSSASDSAPQARDVHAARDVDRESVPEIEQDVEQDQDVDDRDQTEGHDRAPVRQRGDDYDVDAQADGNADSDNNDIESASNDDRIDSEDSIDGAAEDNEAASVDESSEA